MLLGTGAVLGPKVKPVYATAASGLPLCAYKQEKRGELQADQGR